MYDLKLKHLELTEHRKALAAEGDITGCDFVSADIETIERAMALCDGVVGCVIAAYAADAAK